MKEPLRTPCSTVFCVSTALPGRGRSISEVPRRVESVLRGAPDSSCRAAAQFNIGAAAPMRIVKRVVKVPSGIPFWRVAARSAAAAVLVVTATIVFRPSAKPVYLETTTARYRVLSARYVVGTNLSFAQDEPPVAWYRRTRKAVRLPMRGFPGDWTFRDGLKRRAIAILCDGRFPINQMSQIAQENEAACIDDEGRTIHFSGMTSIARNDERFWFVWSYAESELANLQQRGYADFQVTNFCPRQLCLFRKSDHHELTRLELSR